MSDPGIRDQLERAAKQVPVDLERALSEVGRRSARRRRARSAATATVLAVVVALIGFGVALRPPDRDEGFVNPSSAPTGKVAFLRSGPEGGTDLWAIDLDTGAEHPLAREAGAVTAAAWSPDGASAAYTVEEDGGERYALVIVGADGSNPVRIVEHEKAEGTLGPDFISVSWSPDGSHLAYSGRSPGRGRTVSIVASDGSGERVLDGHWEAVSWSRGGELLLLGWPEGGSEGRHELYSMRPDGTGLTRLTDDPATEFNPSWSPGGTMIVFAIAEGSTAPDVAVLDPVSLETTLLTRDPGFDLGPVWSPDGGWIVFASDRDATPEQRRATASGDAPAALSMYAMRADGSDIRLVVSGANGSVLPVSWID